jgi:hypothetical protein
MLSKLFRFFSPPPTPRASAARRSAMHKDAGPTTTLQLLEAEEPANWTRWRTPERDMDRVLSSTALAWLAALPDAVRPADLATLHPRVVNRIALCWNDPELTGRLFDELLLDKRGKRRGFGPAVADDLLRLRVYHGKQFAKALESKAVWQLQSVAVSDRDSASARLGRPAR